MRIRKTGWIKGIVIGSIVGTLLTNWVLYSYAGMGACHNGSGGITQLEIDANKSFFEQTNCVYYEVLKEGVTQADFDRIYTVINTIPRKYVKWLNEPIEMTAGEKAAVDTAEAAQAVTNLRTGAKDQFNGQHVTALALRCEAKAILDEVNTLRTWTRDLKAAIAAASTLAQVKTNVAALSPLNDRTLTQAKTAIQGCIDAGSADEP